MTRACIDWPSGEGRVDDDVTPFLEAECASALERDAAIAALGRGRTYTDPRGRWSLTPVPSAGRGTRD